MDRPSRPTFTFLTLFRTRICELQREYSIVYEVGWFPSPRWENSLWAPYSSRFRNPSSSTLSPIIERLHNNLTCWSFTVIVTFISTFLGPLLMCGGFVAIVSVFRDKALMKADIHLTSNWFFSFSIKSSTKIPFLLLPTVHNGWRERGHQLYFLILSLPTLCCPTHPLWLDLNLPYWRELYHHPGFYECSSGIIHLMNEKSLGFCNPTIHFSPHLREKSIPFCWVSSHVAVLENEHADREVQHAASSKISNEQFFAIDFQLAQ